MCLTLYVCYVYTYLSCVRPSDCPCSLLCSSMAPAEPSCSQKAAMPADHFRSLLPVYRPISRPRIAPTAMLAALTATVLTMTLRV